jgi:nucleoside-diphosphate-sugar epimerase
MKLLVMGAGYVGMSLLRGFQKQSHEIFITTTQEERIEILKPYGKSVLLLNQTENKALNDLINASDGMFILVAPKNSQSYEETYLNTAKKISSVLKDRKNPFYILYTSSTSVCEGLNEWVTEEMPLSPKSENAKILLETERYYLNCGVSTCILRLGGVYGPHRELIDRARRFSGKEMSGTGNEATNHIHLEDIVNAITFCMEHSLTGVYHLVNEEHRTRQELYSTLCGLISLPGPIWRADSIKSTEGYKISNRKIKQAGFVFKHPLILY